jgi:hypothetical protein
MIEFLSFFITAASVLLALVFVSVVLSVVLAYVIVFYNKWVLKKAVTLTWR